MDPTPRRGPPIAIAALSAAALLAAFLAPWIVDLGGRTAEVVGGSDLKREGYLPPGADDPVGWAVLAGVLGLAIGLGWLALTFFAPRLLTPAGEGALLAAAGVPAGYAIAAGSLGLALSFDAMDTGTGAAYAPAPMVLLLAGLSGGAALVLALARRLGRRAPAVALGIALLATALLHAVPWTTLIPEEGGEAESQYLHHDRQEGSGDLGFTFDDPYDNVKSAVLWATLGAAAWGVAAALVPPAPRVRASVDVAFALLACLPWGMAATSAGRAVGQSVSSLLDTRNEFTVLNPDGFVFAILLGASAWLIVRALRDRLAELEVAA